MIDITESLSRESMILDTVDMIITRAVKIEITQLRAGDTDSHIHPDPQCWEGETVGTRAWKNYPSFIQLCNV